MPQISIIIPVYNAEKTLRRCLDSILRQEYRDYEIIIINDGSKDRSEDVVLEYYKKTDRIRYFIKPNSGVADTRNYGLNVALGDYIVFVDADDYVKASIFTDIEEYLEQGVELIKWKSILIDNEGKPLEKIDGPVFAETTGENGFNKLCFEDVFLDALWVYAIKRSIFIENNLKFQSDTFHEDFGLLPLIIVKAKSMVSINKYNYYYVQTENSIMRGSDNSKESKKAYDSLKQYDIINETIKSYDIKELTKENIRLFCTNTIISKVNLLSKDDKKEYIKQIKKRKMTKNIKVRNIKQLIKRIILSINIKLYLKLK